MAQTTSKRLGLKAGVKRIPRRALAHAQNLLTNGVRNESSDTQDITMSKRIYELDVNDVGEMVGYYMREKYPELADLSTNTDVVLKFNKRKKGFIVEIEL
jgi:hypothetical protein